MCRTKTLLYAYETQSITVAGREYLRRRHSKKIGLSSRRAAIVAFIYCRSGHRCGRSVQRTKGAAKLQYKSKSPSAYDSREASSFKLFHESRRLASQCFIRAYVVGASFTHAGFYRSSFVFGSFFERVPEYSHFRYSFAVSR